MLIAAGALLAGCRTAAPPTPAAEPARHLLLVTVDTLRADRVGAYGDRSAETPAIDGLAARGTRFSNAFAVAPVTLPAHATLLTGRYPVRHAARHNGLRLDAATPTLGETLSRAGFATAAFVAAFPLDRRFGLDRGFAEYGDRMPRAPNGRLANERPGRVVVDEALAWLAQRGDERIFLWVHLFEPHAPYGDARDATPAAVRYAAEITEADRQIARLVGALGPRQSSTLVVVTADHGEAFGEHGEVSHSVFVYDTTLRIPLVMAGPGVPAAVVDAPVSQVDLVPTVLPMLGMAAFETDGVDLTGLMAGGALAERPIYAESFAPLLDFGWSPLRAIREGGWKYIAAPRPELYHVAADQAESRNRAGEAPEREARLAAQVAQYSGVEVRPASEADREARARLQALGYTATGATSANHPDPKDRRALAARIAQATSGEVHGAALERLLREILAEDPANPVANVRLGYALVDGGRCRDAEARFRAAIAARYPSADPHLGLAGCLAAARDFAAAAQALRDGAAVEPGNPVVLANLGLVLSDGGNPAAAVAPLTEALALVPDMHQARFGLAIALARDGRQMEAQAQARELLARLPAAAPQRPEVERLLAALR